MFRTAQLLQPGHDANRMTALEWLADAHVKTSSLQTLLDWVNNQDFIPGSAYVDDNMDLPWLQRICGIEGWCQPPRFTLKPVNSLALLCHWRVIAPLVSRLTQDQRQTFRDMKPAKLNQPASPGEDSAGEYQVVEEIGYDSEDPVPAPEAPVPVVSVPEATVPGPSQVSGLQAFDSHFHLDRATSQILGRDQPFRIPALIRAEVGPAPRLPVTVSGGICVFCDPKTYPSQFPTDAGFRSAIGFHPRHAPLLCTSILSRIEELLRSPLVLALGEVGLDFTEPESTWMTQQRALQDLLEYSMPVRPLILHLRDGDNPYGVTSGLACLRIARDCLAPTQRIHLHCFTGNLAMLMTWSDHFPRTYFGFSGLVRHFDVQQVSALIRVPEDKLLLETDSPYLRPSPRGGYMNTPAYVGDVATLVLNAGDVLWSGCWSRHQPMPRLSTECSSDVGILSTASQTTGMPTYSGYSLSLRNLTRTTRSTALQTTGLSLLLITKPYQGDPVDCVADDRRVLYP